MISLLEGLRWVLSVCLCVSKFLVPRKTRVRPPTTIPCGGNEPHVRTSGQCWGQVGMRRGRLGTAPSFRGQPALGKRVLMEDNSIKSFQDWDCRCTESKILLFQLLTSDPLLQSTQDSCSSCQVTLETWNVGGFNSSCYQEFIPQLLQLSTDSLEPCQNQWGRDSEYCRILAPCMNFREPPFPRGKELKLF